MIYGFGLVGHLQVPPRHSVPALGHSAILDTARCGGHVEMIVMMDEGRGTILMARDHRTCFVMPVDVGLRAQGSRTVG